MSLGCTESRLPGAGAGEGDSPGRRQRAGEWQVVSAWQLSVLEPSSQDLEFL